MVAKIIYIDAFLAVLLTLWLANLYIVQGAPHTRCIMGSRDKWGFSPVFWPHWQSPCKALTTGNLPAVRLCKGSVKESRSLVPVMYSLINGLAFGMALHSFSNALGYVWAVCGNDVKCYHLFTVPESYYSVQYAHVLLYFGLIVYRIGIHVHFYSYSSVYFARTGAIVWLSRY